MAIKLEGGGLAISGGTFFCGFPKQYVIYCSGMLQDLVDICSFCNKAFNKERDKNSITKASVPKTSQLPGDCRDPL